MRQAKLWTTAVALACAGVAQAQNWPSFRGPSASGVADRQDLPLRWDVKTGENVRFATEVPGLGHSSPVVWGGLVFLTTAVAGSRPDLKLGDSGGIDMTSDESLSWRLVCIDAREGRILWATEVAQGTPAEVRSDPAARNRSRAVTT